jgi:hypothetical protein
MTTYNVKSGENLQTAVFAASLGDEVIVEPGAYGPLTLPNLPGTGTLTIRSSALEALGGPGKLVGPQNSAALAHIVSPGMATNAMKTQPGAHNILLQGIELRPADANAFIYDLVLLGDATAAQNTLDSVPHHLTLDQCYLHAFQDAPLKRGLALNSAFTDLRNCWLSGFKVVGQDSQAIAGWNGPGPFNILNCHIEAAGENLIFGGDAASIPGLIPADVLVQDCVFSKPDSWNSRNKDYAGTHWDCKNLMEFKNAQRVLVDRCIFQNNWVDAQSGSCILFTPRGAGNQVRDITLQNSILRNSAAGIQFLGSDDYSASGQTTGIKVRNTFWDQVATRDPVLGDVGGPPRLFSFVPGPAGGSIDVEISHNTITGGAELIYGQGNNPGLVLKDNLIGFSEYGILGLGKFGTACLEAYFPGYAVSGNVFVGPSAGMVYPDGNVFLPAWATVKLAGMRLASDSPYRGKGENGSDVGCNADLLPGIAAVLPPVGIGAMQVFDLAGKSLFKYP